MHARKASQEFCKSRLGFPYSVLAAGEPGFLHCSNSCLLMQYCANDSNREEVLASFRGALQPLRALLKVGHIWFTPGVSISQR